MPKFGLGARCSAHTKSTGGPCTQPAISGISVCKLHGGRAPQVRRAAERRVAAAKADRAVATLGLPIATDPAEALLDEVCRTAGHVRWLGSLISEMAPESLVWGRSGTERSTTTGGPAVAQEYAQVAETAQPSVWLTLYQAERAHLATVCKAAITCGIAERQVRLAEGQAALVAAVLRAALGDPELGLSAPQIEISHRVAARHLLRMSQTVDAVPARIGRP